MISAEPKKKNKTFSALQERLDNIAGEGYDEDEPASIIGGYRSSRRNGIALVAYSAWFYLIFKTIEIFFQETLKRVL